MIYWICNILLSVCWVQHTHESVWRPIHVTPPQSTFVPTVMWTMTSVSSVAAFAAWTHSSLTTLFCTQYLQWHSIKQYSYNNDYLVSRMFSWLARQTERQTDRQVDGWVGSNKGWLEIICGNNELISTIASKLASYIHKSIDLKI